MTSIATSVVVVVASLLVVFLVFLAVARGVRDDEDYEVEVRLFPPTIRRKVKRHDRRSRNADTVHYEEAQRIPDTSGMLRASGSQSASPRLFRQREQKLNDDAHAIHADGDN